MMNISEIMYAINKMENPLAIENKSQTILQ